MNNNPKRIMVDMSVTVFHHGHIRLLKAASELGYVIVALTVDEEIETAKGFRSFLNYEQRKEILESIRYVDEVVPSRWLIDDEYLDLHNIDLLVHGEDNSNPVSKDRLLLLPRTENVSSSALRERLDKDFFASSKPQKPPQAQKESAQEMLEEALALQRENEVPAAIEIYRQLILLDSGNMLAHYNLALALDSQGQGEAAIDSYRTAIEVNPEYVAAYNNLGIVLTRAGRPQEAVPVFRKVIEIKPDYGRAHTNLCQALLAISSYPEAVETGRLAVKYSPELRMARNNLGIALMECGQLEESVQCYRYLLEKDDGDHLAHSNLATTLDKQGFYNESKTHYERAIELKSSFLRPYVNSAWLNMVLDDNARSIALSMSAMRLSSAQTSPIRIAAQSSPPKILKSESCLEALLKISQVFEEQGATFFLSFGTLLGCVRDGDFISYDTDIDLGIWGDVDRPSLAKALISSGFEIRLKLNKDTGQSLEDRLNTAINIPVRYKGNIPVDLYLHYEADGKVLSGMEIGNQPILYEVSPFETEEMGFLGHKFLVPKDADKYLTECYGDWRTPDTNFETSLSSPNIQGGFPAHVRAFAYYRVSKALLDKKYKRGMALLSLLLEKPEDENREELLQIQKKFQDRLLT